MDISRMLAAAAVVIAASSPLGTAQAGEKLTADEIAALFPGQYEAIWKNKHEVHVIAGTDGQISGSYGIISGSGQWSIVGDQLCVSSRWWSGNRPRCSELERQEGWYLGMQNGKGKPRLRFRPL
jgi:hypothetical protein